MTGLEFFLSGLLVIAVVINIIAWTGYYRHTK